MTVGSFHDSPGTGICDLPGSTWLRFVLEMVL